MSYINAASTGNFVKVLVRVASGSAPVVGDFYSTGAVTSGTLDVPALQDITIDNKPAVFRWQQLDTASDKVVTAPTVNAMSGNFVLDPATFFGSGSGSTATAKGIFNLSNEKTKIDFLVAFSGLNDTGSDHYVMGSGYFSNLAPTIKANAPVWVSPLTVEVDGVYITGTV
jgi:hypothetical protein